MIRHNVDFCNHASKYFSFESYSNADDKNQYKTIFISHVKNKNRELFHLNLSDIKYYLSESRSILAFKATIKAY